MSILYAQYKHTNTQLLTYIYIYDMLKWYIWFMQMHSRFSAQSCSILCIRIDSLSVCSVCIWIFLYDCMFFNSCLTRLLYTYNKYKNDFHCVHRSANFNLISPEWYDTMINIFRNTYTTHFIEYFVFYSSWRCKCMGSRKKRAGDWGDRKSQPRVKRCHNSANTYDGNRSRISCDNIIS